MNKIGLVTDEGADLTKEIIEEHQIAVVPVKMDWPEIEKIPGENTFQKMRELERRGIKSFGKTSQPSPNDFVESFKQQLERFDKILCITLTSKLSGTYNSANLARNFLKPGDQERIFIIDSLSASAGEALVVLRAIDLIEEKKMVEDIKKELESLIPKIHVFAIFKDPKWIEASGRISTILADWIRRMAKLGVRPLLGFKKGTITSIGIITRAKDIPTAMFRRFKLETKKLRKRDEKIRIVLTHGDNLAEIQRLKGMIEKEFSNIETALVNLIDNVLGVLTGPDIVVCGWCEI